MMIGANAARLFAVVSVFCPGTSVLPDGRIMMTGGSTSYATTFYNYQNNQWSVGPQMILPRGYQAHTLLANGEVFCYGGSWSGGDQWDRRAEVWSPQSNTWRLLQDVPSAPAETRDVRGRYRSDNHYWLYVAPNGNVRQVIFFFYTGD
jgi:galactose oxidase